MLFSLGNVDFPQIPHGPDAMGLKVACHGLVNVLRGYIVKTNLHSIIAVCLFCFDLRHCTGARLDDRNRHDIIIIIPDLCHSELTANDRVDHTHSLPSVVMGPHEPECC